MKKLLTILTALCALASTTPAQQVDQPDKVFVDFDVTAFCDGSAENMARVYMDLGEGPTAWIFSARDDDVYADTTDLLPVGDEITVSFDTERVYSVEFFATPPPGYEIVLDDDFSRKFYKHGGAGYVGDFTVKMRIVPASLSQLAAGRTSFPQVGTFLWEIGLGHLPNGQSAGSLSIRQKNLADIYARESLRFGRSPHSDLEYHRDTNGNLQRVRSDILIDVTDLTDGYRIDFYPAGAFSATADLDSTSGLITGNAFRRVEVQKASATEVELRVFDMNGGTATQLVEHTVSYDSGNDKWTLESGDGTTVVRTETYDYGTNRDHAVILVKDGSTELRKTYKAFEDVNDQRDVVQIIADYGVNNYTTTLDYTGSATDWMDTVQAPDGSWEHTQYDVIGRPTKVYRAFKDSSTTPGAYTSGEVTSYDYDQATVPVSASASDVLPAVSNWYANEYRSMPTLETVEINGVMVQKTDTDYSITSLNSRRVVQAVSSVYSASSAALSSTSKWYSSLLPSGDGLFAGLPVSEASPDGTKMVWLHQPGAYTEGGSTLTSFAPATSYDATTSNRYWRTIVFHGRSNGSGTISSFGSGAGNAIEPIYMEQDRSTIEVTVRGYQGKVVQSETYVFTGSTSTSANLAANYDRIDWTRHEYKGEWGYRLWRSSSIRTETGHYDVNNTYSGGRLVSAINALGQKVSFTYDALGRVVQETLLDSSDVAERSTLTWYNAAGDVTATAQIPGSLTTIPGDPSALTASPRLVSTMEYDKGGRVTRTVDAAGVETRYDYDKVGAFYRDFVTEQDVPDPANPAATTTATVTERKHLDGRTEKVTGDTVERFYAYTVDGSGADSGYLTVRESLDSASSVRWSQSTTDWLGRVVQKEAPKTGSGTLSQAFEYYSAGQGGNSGKLKKSTAPGRYPILYRYDDLGQLEVQWLDVDNDGILDEDGTDGLDRVTRHETKVVDFNSAKFLERSTYGYPNEDDDTQILLSRTRERLTGFALETVPVYNLSNTWMNAERYVYDVDSNTATTNYAAIERGFIDPDNGDRALYQATSSRGESIPAVSKSLDGFLIETRTPAGVKTTFGYDGLGRQETVTTRENGSDKVINKTIYMTDSPLVYQQKRTRDSATADTLVSQYSYYGNGALKSTLNADGEISYQLYNKRGQLTHQWGSASNPIKHVYDDYGARTEMHTYQAGTWTGSALPASFGSATASKTEWVYEASTGLLTEKRDALYATDSSRKESYSYDAAHRLSVLTRARGGTITHSYAAATGELTGKAYSDTAMTDLAFTYDRLGAMKSVTDVTGQRTWNYRSSDRRLDYISLPGSFYGANRRLTLEYDTTRRARDAMLFGEYVDMYDNDTDAFYRSEWVRSNGRISQVKAYDRGSSTTARTFAYGFATNSNLISSVSTASVGSASWTQTTTYQPYENRKNLFTATHGSSKYNSCAFTYDVMGRIATTLNKGQLYDGFGTTAEDTLKYVYSYSASGRLESALGYVFYGPFTHALHSRQFYYTYDHAGNQDWSSRWADGSSNADYKKDYTADLTNAYSGIANATMDVLSGEVTSGAVTIWDNERGGWIGSGEIDQPGSGSVFEHDFDKTTGNTTSAPFDRQFFFSNPSLGWQKWTYPRQTQSPTYDKDGNLLSDGVFSYGYDLENRLIWIMSDAADYIGFKYDFRGRRVEAVFWDHDGTTWNEIYTKRYVYDGWHLIAEVDATTGVSGLPVTQTYFWGYDISGSIGGAGTIGGLLMIDDGSDQFLPGYDGRGNVSVLVDESDGALVAQFEYDPYGQTLRKEGAYDKIPFRYQTKWDLGFGSEDVVWYPWNHLDYGLRWYRPDMGRFINRDPIGEAGGNNLYEAFAGDPINRYDLLGMDDEVAEEEFDFRDIQSSDHWREYLRGRAARAEALGRREMVTNTWFSHSKLVDRTASAAIAEGGGGRSTPLLIKVTATYEDGTTVTKVVSAGAANRLLENNPQAVQTFTHGRTMLVLSNPDGLGMGNLAGSHAHTFYSDEDINKLIAGGAPTATQGDLTVVEALRIIDISGRRTGHVLAFMVSGDDSGAVIQSIEREVTGKFKVVGPLDFFEAWPVEGGETLPKSRYPKGNTDTFEVELPEDIMGRPPQHRSGGIRIKGLMAFVPNFDVAQADGWEVSLPFTSSAGSLHMTGDPAAVPSAFFNSPHILHTMDASFGPTVIGKLSNPNNIRWGTPVFTP